MERLLEKTSLAERRHFWFRGFRRFVAPLVAQAVGGIPNPRILDCGCGTGANLRGLLGAAGLAHGVDLTFLGLTYARRAGTPRVAQATVTDLPFGDAQFDLVTSFDVLYSLPDPAESRAIGEMHRVLKPRGALIVNVAALEALRGNHSVLSHEVRRYTRASLRQRLERAGFRIERLTYTNATLLPVLLPVRLAQRMAGLAGSEDEASLEITVPPAPINAALTALLALESLVLRAVDLPAGSSLLALARRS